MEKVGLKSSFMQEPILVRYEDSPAGKVRAINILGPLPIYDAGTELKKEV